MNLHKSLSKDEDVEFEHSYNESKKKLVATNITGINGNKLNCENNNKIHKPKNKNKHRKKNTQSFDPDLTEPDMRIIIKADKNNDSVKFDIQMKENDVVILDKYFQNTFVLLQL